MAYYVFTASVMCILLILLVDFSRPVLRLLRGVVNFHNVSCCKFQYPDGSVGHLLAQDGFRRSIGKPPNHLADLMVLLRAELFVPTLLTSSATVAACNLYTWPGSNFSKDNGHCYSCLLCKCDVCTPAKQWLTHVSGHNGRLFDWHRHSITNQGRLASIATVPQAIEYFVYLTHCCLLFRPDSNNTEVCQYC